MTRNFFSISFSEDGDFASSRAAEVFLAAKGFSVGIMQGPSPRGILFGDILISKWRNMNKREIAALHGVMTGPMRNGPVKITIYDSAPEEAKAALMKARAA